MKEGNQLCKREVLCAAGDDYIHKFKTDLSSSTVASKLQFVSVDVAQTHRLVRYLRADFHGTLYPTKIGSFLGSNLSYVDFTLKYVEQGRYHAHILCGTAEL